MNRDALEPRPRTLHELLGNGTTYKIPPFQRDYAWDIAQWSDLWTDITALAAPVDGQLQDQHYMGYLVLQRKAEREIAVVDGQQHMITLSILARVVADSITNKEIGDKLRQSYLYVKGIVQSLPEPRVVPNLLNRSFYRQYIVESKPFPAQQWQNLSNRKICKAYTFFKERVDEELADRSDEERANFFDRQVGDGLIFTVLEVKDEEAAFTIFETLNARGMELSSSDLLRNRLFSILHEADRTEQTMTEMSNRWQEASDMLGSEKITAFLRHFWMSRGGIEIHRNNLFRLIRKEINTPNKVVKFIDEMKTAAEVYRDIASPKQAQWGKYYEHLAALVLYNTSEHNPLLLAAHKAWGTSPEFGRLAHICAVGIFRHFVVGGLNPNLLAPIFAQAVGAILNEERTANHLWPHLQSLYLDDKRFSDAFEDMIISHSQKALAKHILFRLEYKRSGNDYSPDSAMYSLEHIFPQNPTTGWAGFDARTSEQWLWRIGNLTLLDAADNKKAGSKPFAAKRTIYANSRFQITKECAEYPEWTPDTITQRQRALADTACAVWKLDFTKGQYEE